MVEKASVTSEPAPQPQPQSEAVPQGTVQTGLGAKGKGTRTVIEGPAPAGPAPAPDRPSWLPSKFKTPEELAASYAQLEQKLGGGTAAPASSPAPSPGLQPAAPAQPGQTVPNLSDAFNQEFAQTGKVSPELRKRFTESTGLDESFIDKHLDYLRIQQQNAVDVAARRLGGSEAVRELNDWGAKNMTQEERIAFNRAVHSGDDAMVQMAVDALNARYEAAVGRPPRIMAGRRPQADHGGIVPFQSNAELLAAQSDPRYDRDPAYRAMVQDRLRLAMRMGLVD